MAAPISPGAAGTTRVRALVRGQSAGGVRVVLALVGGVLWWLAVLRFGLRPDTSGGPAGGVHAAIVAGGWSLGLIPMHAVPARRREAARRRRTKATAPVPAGSGLPGDQLLAEDDAGPGPGSGAGAGPRWHRGHQ